MLILGPKNCFVPDRRCIDNAIRHRQRMARSLQGQRTIQVDNPTVLHLASDLKRIILAPLSKNLLEDFVNGNDWHEKVLRVFDGSCK